MRKKLLVSLAWIALVGIGNAQEVVKITSRGGGGMKPLPKFEKSLPESTINEQIISPRKSETTTRAGENGEKLSYIKSDTTRISRLNLGEDATYQAATYFPPSIIQRLKGNKIKTISFILLDNVSDVHIWLAKDLSGTKEFDYTVSDLNLGKVSTVTLPVPYELGDEGLFLGMTMTGTKTTSHVATSSIPYPNTLLLDFGDGRDFGDFSGNPKYGSLFMECTTEGDKRFSTHDVAFEQWSNVRAKCGETFEISGILTNYGNADVTSFGVNYTLNGETKHADLRFNGFLPWYGSAQFTIQSTTPQADGRYVFDATIDKVNNVADEYAADNKQQSYLVNMQEPAVRKVVMEEATGTWCGWCPRGMVGIENLKKKYPDTFIAIAIHADDEMQADSYLPIVYNMKGFPSSLIDRKAETDPYQGNNNTLKFAADVVVEAAQKVLSEAALGIATNYTAANNTVNITTSVKFSARMEGCPYQLAYAITEDNITGPVQANYYAQYSIYSLPADLRQFGNKTSAYLSGLTFNHVARGIYNCYGIEGSLVGNITKDEVKQHTYTIKLPSSIVNKDNVHLVVMLLDATDGTIVNAEEVKLGESTATGIAQAEAALKAEINVEGGYLRIATETAGAVAELYTTDGTKVAATVVAGNASIPVSGLKGVYIVRVNNGKDVVVKKVTL